MNFVHLHLAINHSPLYATLFAFFFVLIGVIRRNRTVVTTGLIIAIVAALCALAADFTGNKAADIIGHSPPIGVDTTLIHEHDLAATFVVISSCICAGVALILFFFRRRWLEIVLVVLLAWSFSVVARTALLGGRIHHPEVRAVVEG